VFFEKRFWIQNSITLKKNITPGQLLLDIG